MPPVEEEFSISELQLLRGLLVNELSNLPSDSKIDEWRNHVKRTLDKVDRLEDQITGG